MMGYDRQTSPFGTRVLLTCYCLFLLVNVLLYSNNVYRIKKLESHSKYELEIIFLGFTSILVFLINFYGLWFAKIAILCFIVLLFSMLLGTTIISLVLILTDVITINSKIFSSLQNSLYFAHNYLWLLPRSTPLFYIISLTVSCLLNILALWGTCHLCSCVEYQHQSCSYRKRPSKTII